MAAALELSVVATAALAKMPRAASRGLVNPITTICMYHYFSMAATRKSAEAVDYTQTPPSSFQAAKL